MSRIGSEYLDVASPDSSIAVDVLLRQEPEEEDDEDEVEEEDEGGEGNDDDGDDGGYSV